MKPIDFVSETASDGPRSTIFLVDDDPSVRKALARLFRVAGYEVESFDSASAYLHRPRFEGNGCLVLDIQMPGMNGLDLQDVLAKGDSDLPVIFITGYGDVPMSVRAMKRGAVDFLAKPVDQRELLQAVRTAIDKHRDQCRLHRERQQVLARIDALTPREREVMDLVVAGRMNKQIAQELAIAEATVKAHRGRVMKKMQAESVSELVRFSMLGRPSA